jgi:hypothetical protein
MRKLALSLLVLFLTGLAAGQVSYSISSTAEEVDINTTLKLDCGDSSRCPVNQWTIPGWPLPDSAEVISVRDSLGKIEEYTVEGDSLSIETNSGDRRRSETVRIHMRVPGDAESIYRGLKKRSLSIPSIPEGRTSGTLRQEDLVSGRTGFGFDASYSDNVMNFTGTGPTNIRIKFGEGNETEYFEFFGTDDIRNSELAYEVSVGMTGQVQNFERFPVAVMDSKSFNESVGRWSAGEYVGGSIKLRKSLGAADKAAVLAHETVHGLNDRELNWDNTRSSYIDEGTGKFVEFLIRKRVQEEKKIAELFGDDKTFREERDGKTYRITIPSRGDRDELWNYYRNDQDFMKDWNPSDFAEQRSFGYAYSDLIIRNYIVNMNGSMRDLYTEIRPGKVVESNEEKWRIYSQVLDLTPCEYEERERFDRCLDRINDREYSLTRATEIDRGDRRVLVEEIELREREDNGGEKDGSGNRTGGVDRAVSETSGNFFAWLGEFFRSLLGIFQW